MVAAERLHEILERVKHETRVALLGEFGYVAAEGVRQELSAACDRFMRHVGIGLGPIWPEDDEIDRISGDGIDHGVAVRGAHDDVPVLDEVDDGIGLSKMKKAQARVVAHFAENMPPCSCSLVKAVVAKVCDPERPLCVALYCS